MPDTLLEIKLDKLRRLRELQQQKHDVDTGDALRKPWAETARADQQEPDGDWFVWLILAGRGWGKTRTAAELMAEKARRFAGARIALVGRTFSDTRDTMIEGDSGLLSCFKASELRGGKIDGAHNRSLGELYLENGTKFFSYSSEKPWQLRGPQFHFAWGDEACFWADAHKGTTADTTWSNLTIATRLPRKAPWPLDYKSSIVVATTPRPVALLKVSDPQQVSPGLMQRDNVIITRGRTVDNLENLNDNYKANVVAPLLGTQLGLQELDGEILENRENALWKREWIEADRYNADRLDSLDLVRIVVGVDPSVTSSETADLTGIVVCGADRAGNGYVLADYTMRGTPKQCMQRAVEAYHEFKADRVVAEVNNGGDYIGTVLRAVDNNVAFKAVRASRGKNTRAEPISALYEQHRVHHIGMFPQLEDEMCTWAPGDPESPDRMDACLIAGTMVLTKRGDVPIEDVIPGEQVWTRQGWRPVHGTRCTQRNTKTITVELSNGQQLTGTPDHQVWTDEHGWSRLDALMPNDALAGWAEEIDPQPVPVYVVQSFAGLRSDVYDLMIDDVHEFVANGVIVHNCVWAMYDLKDLIGGSWLDAYGIIKCHQCERPFTAKSGGVPRTKCPYCNTSLGEVA